MGVIAADFLTGIRAQFQPGPGITFLDSANYAVWAFGAMDPRDPIVEALVAAYEGHDILEA